MTDLIYSQRKLKFVGPWKLCSIAHRCPVINLFKDINNLTALILSLVIVRLQITLDDICINSEVSIHSMV